jgi:microcystin-dependent protein
MTTPVTTRRSVIGRLAAAAGLVPPRPGRPQVRGTIVPYIGEIRMFAGNFAPAGWMLCQGQLLQISEFDTLYQLIGTTYGGDGQDTFALPDLSSRVPMHHGQGPGLTSRIIGESDGREEVTLTLAQIPEHGHAAGASSAIGDSDAPAGRVPARNAAGVPRYGVADTTLAADALLPTGGSIPHTNMQPFLGIHYIISLYGIFPPPN